MSENKDFLCAVRPKLGPSDSVKLEISISRYLLADLLEAAEGESLDEMCSTIFELWLLDFKHYLESEAQGSLSHE